MSNLEPRDDKEEFLRALEEKRPDLMKQPLSSESRDIAADALRGTNLKMNMLSSIPMICKGDMGCPVSDSCPLWQQGLRDEILNKPCPIELSMVRQFFLDYVEEFEVDTARMAEVSLIRDLVDQEIQQIRKSWVLGREHFIQENVVGLDQDGKVITKKELHQAVEFEDKILRRKKDLRNALLATREAKAKAGSSLKDTAQNLADIMTNIRQMEIDKDKKSRLEQGKGMRDDYIDAEIVEEEDEA